MQLRTLGLTENAVDALDSATDSLRRILRGVAAEYAEVNGQSAITTDCIERALKRVTQALVSEKSTDWRTKEQLGNRFKSQPEAHRRYPSDLSADSVTHGDGDAASSKELAGVR